MKCKWLKTLFIVCHCLPVMISALHAQKLEITVQEKVEGDYLEFRKLFEQELDEQIRESPEDSININRSLFDVSFPAVLPEWVVEIPGSKGDSLYILGISEPGMDSVPGYDIAVRRALVILALTGMPDVANIRDFYSTISDNNILDAYIEFTRFLAEVNVCTGNVDVINSHVTRYDETIVLVRISRADLNRDDMQESRMQLNAGLYSHLRGSGSYDINEKLEMEAFFYEDDREPLRMKYQYSVVNKIVNTETFLNDQLVSELPVLGLRYTYRGFESGEYCSDSFKSGFSLRNGLWHALIAGLLSSLSDAVNEGSIHFRQVGDLYNNMPVFLSRESVNGKVAFSMPSLMVKNNFLYLLFPDQAH